ncbi:hypothetical protein SDC9_198643 [bioreactor metagenome]|uniref:Uncharacterized protein n=1 Tax=bioreactor metagenome TaxID=1076179 RepID=A0A645IJG9_9ZZZZ
MKSNEHRAKRTDRTCIQTNNIMSDSGCPHCHKKRIFCNRSSCEISQGTLNAHDFPQGFFQFLRTDSKIQVCASHTLGQASIGIKTVIVQSFIFGIAPDEIAVTFNKKAQTLIRTIQYLLIQTPICFGIRVQTCKFQAHGVQSSELSEGPSHDKRVIRKAWYERTFRRIVGF